MRRTVAAVIALLTCTVMGAAREAGAVSVRFNEVNLGPSTQVDLTNQFGAYGVTFTDVYRYIDAADPFADSHGIANGSVANNFAPGAIGHGKFTAPTTASGMKFDWWTIFAGMPETLTVTAYNASGAVIGSFVSPMNNGTTPTGTIFGTATIVGAIDHFDFHNSGGFVQLANLTWNEPAVAPTPEPGTLLLVASAALGGGGAAWRRARQKAWRVR